jgi:hypothetical protein
MAGLVACTPGFSCRRRLHAPRTSHRRRRCPGIPLMSWLASLDLATVAACTPRTSLRHKRGTSRRHERGTSRCPRIPSASQPTRPDPAAAATRTPESYRHCSAVPRTRRSSPGRRRATSLVPSKDWGEGGTRRRAWGRDRREELAIES